MQWQYLCNIGCKVEVKFNDGDKCMGMFLEVEEDYIVLEEKVWVQEGKCKKMEVVEIEIFFSSIEYMKVKIIF